MSSPSEVSAPGKLFLVGEYAVLEGGAAVVAAVDRRAVGHFLVGATPTTALVAEAVRAARAHLEEIGADLPPGAPMIDSAALSGQGGKLGLGSSAAVAAVAVGAMFEAAGRSVAQELPLAFALAERAHRIAQGGRGSGADVAAAVHGGVLRYVRAPGGSAAPTIEPLGPAPVQVVAFSAGAPRATVDGIRAIEALAARDPALCGRRLRAIADPADAFARAWRLSDGPAVVEAAAAAGEALAALGQDAALEIWTWPARTAAALAHELGGAAKPSGAGGGDVGVAFLTTQDAAAAFRERAPALGVRILSIRTSGRGLGRDA